MNYRRSVKTIMDYRGDTVKSLADKNELSESLVKNILKRLELSSLSHLLHVTPEVIMLLALSKKDIPKKNQHLYEFVWPQYEQLFLKLFL